MIGIDLVVYVLLGLATVGLCVGLSLLSRVWDWWTHRCPFRGGW